MGESTCPACESEITERNLLIKESEPEIGCYDCYDGAPMYQWEVTQ